MRGKETVDRVLYLFIKLVNIFAGWLEKHIEWEELDDDIVHFNLCECERPRRLSLIEGRLWCGTCHRLRPSEWGEK